MDVGFKILRDGNSSITGYSDTFAYDFESLGVTITSTSIFYYDTSFKLTSVENYLNSGPTTADVIVSSLTITRSGGDLVELGETYSGGDTSNPVSSYEYTYNTSTGAFQGGFTIDEGGLKTIYNESWEVLSQTQSVGALSQLSSADGIAFTLFGAAHYDADTYTASGERTTITSYFQADGTLFGTSNTIETLDGSNNVVSTYTSFSNKDWVFIGEEYSDATSSQWRTITKQADLDDRDDGADFIIVDTSEFSVGNSVQSHETSFYSYDSATFVGGQYLGGESLQDGVTTVFDASGRIESEIRDVSALSSVANPSSAYDLFSDGGTEDVKFESVPWVETWGSGIETTYYIEGRVVGTSSTWGDTNYSDTSYYDADGQFLRSEWSDQYGNEGWNESTLVIDAGDQNENGLTTDYIRVEKGYNKWTWDGGTASDTNEYTWYYDASTWEFLGGQEASGSGLVTTYNSDWTVASSARDVSGVTDVLAEETFDGVAYKIFGAAKYIETDSWSDIWGEGSTYEFYNASDELLGTQSFSKWSWEDANVADGIASSENYSFQDAKGEWLGSSWSDSYNNKGSNFVSEDFVLATDAVAIALEANGDVNFVDVTIGGSTVSVVDFDKNGSGDIVRIEEGSNTWSWQEGTTTKTESSTYTRYYPKDGWDMLGGSETMNGQETIYGKHWTVLSSKVDSTYWDSIKAGLADITNDSLSNYDAKAVTLFSEATLYEIGYSHSDGTNSEIEIIYYDDSGNQVGSKWANSWNDGSNVNYHDNNGNQISSSWSNSDGNSGFNSSIKDYVLATDDVAKVLEARGDVSFVDATIGGTTVSVVDFDKDGVADKVRIETNENVWPYIDGNETKYDTRTTINYYELEDSSMPAGGKMLGGIENDGDEVRIFGKDYELISSKLASFNLSDYLDTDDQTKPHYLAKAEELFGATSVYEVDDEWSDGSGNLNVNLTYFDEVGNVLGEYFQNAWNNGQESEIRYQDANYNTLYSKWTNLTGYTERVRAKETDVLDLDGDGSKTDSIIVETENRVESGSLTIRKSYYVDSTGNMPGNNFIGESETTGGVTTYRDSNWHQVDSLADLQLAAPLTLNVAATPTVDSKQFYDAVDKTGSLVGATGMTNTGTYLFSIAPGNDQFDFYDEDGDGKPNYVVYHVANDSWGMQNSGQTWIMSNSTPGAAATAGSAATGAGASVDDSSVSFQLNQSMDNYEFKIGVNANNEVVGLFTSNYLQDLPSITFAISKTPTLEAAPLGYAFADFSDQSGSLLNVTGTGAEGATYKFSVKTSVAQIDFYDTNSDGKVDFALDKWSTDSDGIVQSNVFVNNASTGRISLQDKSDWSEEYFDLVIDSTGDVVGMFLNQEDVSTGSSASASEQTFIDIVDGQSLVSANETVGEVDIVSGDFAVVNILDSGSVPDRAYLVSSAAGAAAPIEISVAQAAAIAEGASNLIPGSQVVVAADSNNASLGSASEVDGQLLIGLGGDDTLTAATGFDVMIGGEGEDDFVIDPVMGQPAIDNFAMDLIVDLGAGDEVILPTGLTYDANYAAGITQKIKDGGFAALDDGDGNTTIVYDADATSNAVSEAFVLLSDVDSRELDLSSPTIVKADKDQLFKDIVTGASLIDTGNGESIGAVMLVTSDFAMVPVVIADQVDRVYLVSSIAGDSPVAVSLEQASFVAQGTADMVPGSVVDLGGDASSDVLGASSNDSGQLLIGLGGNDVLTGASGLDVMIGGAGADDFVIEPVTGTLAVDNFAWDAIIDADVGDEIILPNWLSYDVNYAAGINKDLADNSFAALDDGNGNTVLVYDADDTASNVSEAIVMLKNVDSRDLNYSSNRIVVEDKQQVFKDKVTLQTGESYGAVELVNDAFAMVTVKSGGADDHAFLVSSAQGATPIQITLAQAAVVQKGIDRVFPDSLVDVAVDDTDASLGSSTAASGQLLVGQGGADTLNAADGFDVMIGGAGADDFIIKAVTGSLSISNFAADIIVDFGVGDEIELPTGLTFDSDYSTGATSSLASNKFAAFDVGNGNTTVIYDAGSGSAAIVMLLDVSASHLVTNNDNVIGYV